jgi:hypothetical protein
MKRFAEVNGVRLPILDTPHMDVAHPTDGVTTDTDEKCDKCALAIRPDTGEIVLLWLCGGINWSVSRETPDYERHRTEISYLPSLGRYSRE